MDIKNIDLNLLRAFDALINERNVSRAAGKLFLSQPATSALLARLREVFKDPLLVRSGRGMAPTERALALADPVRCVLADIHDILQPPGQFDSRLSTRTFTIATTEYVAYTVLPAFAKQLEAHAPHIRIAVVAPNHETMVRQMESGSLDLAILNETLIPEQLRSSRFLKDEFCVIARHNHPEIKKRLSLDAFCTLPHVIISPRTGSFFAQTDEALQTLKRKRFAQLSVPYFTLVPEVVANSNMIAVYPTRLANKAAKTVQILKPPLTIPPFSLQLCWHERAHRDSAHQWLRSMVTNCLK
ncbi:MAG TPA: LysR family transcriptional regulator [Burkholderiaceae bacterium]|jgi:DNA-binding transcriptional LysR family regulator